MMSTKVLETCRGI